MAKRVFTKTYSGQIGGHGVKGGDIGGQSNMQQLWNLEGAWRRSCWIGASFLAHCRWQAWFDGKTENFRMIFITTPCQSQIAKILLRWRMTRCQAEKSGANSVSVSCALCFLIADDHWMHVWCFAVDPSPLEVGSISRGDLWVVSHDIRFWWMTPPPCNSTLKMSTTGHSRCNQHESTGKER